MLNSSYEVAREEFYRMRGIASSCASDQCDCYDCCEEDDDDDDADCFCG